MLELCLGLTVEAGLVWDALFHVFESGTTADLPAEGKAILTTSEFGDRVVAAVRRARS